MKINEQILRTLELNNYCAIVVLAIEIETTLLTKHIIKIFERLIIKKV